MLGLRFSPFLIELCSGRVTESSPFHMEFTTRPSKVEWKVSSLEQTSKSMMGRPGWSGWYPPLGEQADMDMSGGAECNLPDLSSAKNMEALTRVERNVASSDEAAAERTLG